METLWERALAAVLSQTGAVGTLCTAIVAYLMWSLAQERSRNERDREQARKEAEQRSEAFKALADSMTALSLMLAEIKGAVINSIRK